LDRQTLNAQKSLTERIYNLYTIIILVKNIFKFYSNFKKRIAIHGLKLEIGNEKLEMRNSGSLSV